jgi:hypothetical protein
MALECGEDLRSQGVCGAGLGEDCGDAERPGLRLTLLVMPVYGHY